MQYFPVVLFVFKYLPNKFFFTIYTVMYLRMLLGMKGSRASCKTFSTSPLSHLPSRIPWHNISRLGCRQAEDSLLSSLLARCDPKVSMCCLLTVHPCPSLGLYPSPCPCLLCCSPSCLYRPWLSLLAPPWSVASTGMSLDLWSNEVTAK